MPPELAVELRPFTPQTPHDIFASWQQMMMTQIFPLTARSWRRAKGSFEDLLDRAGSKTSASMISFTLLLHGT
jgi:hypothetical protein